MKALGSWPAASASASCRGNMCSLGLTATCMGLSVSGLGVWESVTQDFAAAHAMLLQVQCAKAMAMAISKRASKSNSLAPLACQDTRAVTQAIIRLGPICVAGSPRACVPHARLRPGSPAVRCFQPRHLAAFGMSRGVCLCVCVACTLSG